MGIKTRIEDYNFREDLGTMSLREMELLAIQIRSFLLDKVSQTGGHLASNLGIVELTMAIHKVFDIDKDKIVWDVGHQSYVHKILTGRAHQFDTLRQLDGISGFPKRKESIYDSFDVGHSSISVSVACGFAAQKMIDDEDGEVIAIIGDGALTGGLAYEGLNNLATIGRKSIVIINDNGMSISKNTGGLSKHLARVRVSNKYGALKNNVRTVLKSVPKIGEKIYKEVGTIKNHIRDSVVDGVMFEKMGYLYLGAVDGHDFKSLLYYLALAKKSKESVILHVLTEKGKGYRNAEVNPSKFHGIGAFDVETGALKKMQSENSFSSVFGDKLCRLAESNENIVAISAAMLDGTGLEKFAEKFPARTFDVGIAEGHAATFAGALGVAGKKPVLAVYSTFLQRAYDNIIIDIALQNSPAVLAIDRAGVVGSDGETHHGIFDMAYLKNIPNFEMFAPATFKELEAILEYSVQAKNPVAIRYPRGNDGETISLIEKECLANKSEAWVGEAYLNDVISEFDVHKSLELRKGTTVIILSVGDMLKEAFKASNILVQSGLDVGVANVRCIAPMDKNFILDVATRYEYIVTAEDGIKSGGFGESVAAILSEEQRDKSVLNIAWENRFVEHGTQDELKHRYGLDGFGIAEKIKEFIKL